VLWKRSSGSEERSLNDRDHALYLCDCRGINTESGVSALGNVHTLDLSFCDNITDVGALASVHTLNLSNCRGITDVGALASVHTLNLSNCRGITDVSMNAS
jgi:internalin A